MLLPTKPFLRYRREFTWRSKLPRPVLSSDIGSITVGGPNPLNVKITSGSIRVTQCSKRRSLAKAHLINLRLLSKRNASGNDFRLQCQSASTRHDINQWSCYTLWHQYSRKPAAWRGCRSSYSMMHHAHPARVSVHNAENQWHIKLFRKSPVFPKSNFGLRGTRTGDLETSVSTLLPTEPVALCQSEFPRRGNYLALSYPLT